jgi:hypothetical protein
MEESHFFQVWKQFSRAEDSIESLTEYKKYVSCLFTHDTFSLAKMSLLQQLTQSLISIRPEIGSEIKTYFNQVLFDNYHKSLYQSMFIQ